MHINTLPDNTEEVLNKIKNLSFIGNFYLTGGTALSLQIGHRESQDLDFFNQNIFEPEAIQRELEKIGKLENVEVAQGTLNCFLDNVKLQFLHYPYKLLEPFISWNGINISSKLDIACTKLITASVRGSRKDFIDIYFLLEDYDLETLLVKLSEKYSGINYNEPHILKSLIYFEDADSQPLPRMHKDIDWSQIKADIISQVKKHSF